VDLLAVAVMGALAAMTAVALVVVVVAVALAFMVVDALAAMVVVVALPVVVVDVLVAGDPAERLVGSDVYGVVKGLAGGLE
jgi:hypothetical protein